MPPDETSAEFIQLLTSNQSRLFAYTLSMLGDRQQAQDVMQETNMILWRKADQFRLGTNFGAWMLKVAYFQVVAHGGNSTGRRCSWSMTISSPNWRRRRWRLRR